METGTLILFTLPSKRKEIPANDIVKMYRKLYVYNNSSDYGKYHTRVPGLLERKKHLRYPNGAILLQSGEEHDRFPGEKQGGGISLGCHSFR